MSPIYIIAIDLGGTITKIGLFEDGKLIDHIKMNSRPDLNMATSLPRIEKSINLLMDSHKKKIPLYPPMQNMTME